MSATLQAVVDSLKSIHDAIPNHVTFDKTFLAQHGNGAFPAIARSDLQAAVKIIIQSIESSDLSLDDESDAYANIKSRLNGIANHALPLLAQQPQTSVTAFMLSMEHIERRVQLLLPEPDSSALSTSLTRQRRRVRALESRLAELEPRTTSLDEMLSRIESAHETADQLPADLDYLQEKRTAVEKMAADAGTDRIKTAAALEQLTATKTHIELIATEAKVTLDACKQAYRASTSVGLAAAFSERAEKLNTSVVWWTASLVGALVAAIILGLFQFNRLAILVENPSVPVSVIMLNFLTSALSVGAPIWFAWLATKQIGHRFRLSEDYAFKASISRAYEGYRSEAARIDEDLEVQLLTSALNRLDELPLRLVETQAHGSPWHEILSSEPIQKAMHAIPNFADEVKNLALNKLGRHSNKADPRPQRGTTDDGDEAKDKNQE